MKFCLATLLTGVLCASAIAQEQPQPTRTLPARGPAPARGGFIPAPSTTTPSTVTAAEPNSRTSLLSRPLPPSRPLPTKIGKTLTFEVLIAELYEAVDSPTISDLLQLEKAGKLSFLNRLQLTSLEEQPAYVQFGALTARVTGRATTGLTIVPIYNDINLGTIAQVTGRVDGDGSIVAQYMIERSALAGGDEGPFDPGTATPPKGIERLTTNSTVRLKPGEPQIVGGHQATAAQDTSKTWIVLTGYIGSTVPARKPAAATP